MRKQEEPEVFQTKSIQRHGVGLVILAETARTAGARGEVDIILVGLFLAVKRDFFLQEVHQTSGGENRGTARPDIDQLFAGIEIVASNIRQRLGFVFEIVQSALHHALMFPCQSAE